MPSSGQTTRTRVGERSFPNFPKEDWTGATREGFLDAGQEQQLSAHSLWGSDWSGRWGGGSGWVRAGSQGQKYQDV